MLKLLLSGCLFAVCTIAHAYEEPTYDAFFAIAENQKQFDYLSQSGALNKIRNQMLSSCKQWDKENSDEACACVATEIEKLDDKTLFYNSTLAYKRFMEKVQARKNNDNERLAALNAQFEAAPLTPAIAMNKCENL